MHYFVNPFGLNHYWRIASITLKKKREVFCKQHFEEEERGILPLLEWFARFPLQR
ncbi:hypothetical protein Hdeb2414_s0005g00157921 [Helianthus debilis subsp. tardiflorus]